MTDWHDDQGLPIPTRPFADLVAEGYKRWYQFGARSPRILGRRLRHKHMPIRRTKWAIQRAVRGYSDADAWSFDGYLAALIASGVGYLRANFHSYPPELTIEQWDEILRKIEIGFRLYIDEEERWADDPQLQEQITEARHLFAEWFHHLWD